VSALRQGWRNGCSGESETELVKDWFKKMAAISTDLAHQQAALRKLTHNSSMAVTK